MTTSTTATSVKHHSLRNGMLAVLGVVALAAVGFGIYWIWTEKDSVAIARAELLEQKKAFTGRVSELAQQAKGAPPANVAVTPSTTAPAPAAPTVVTTVEPNGGSKPMTAQETEQLNALLLKKAAILLPPPNGGRVGTMTQTAKIGTPPAGGCRKLVGTKYDPQLRGTVQIWERC